MMKSFLRRSYRLIKYAFLVASCSFFVLLVISLYRTRQICVELPNGAIIGYMAFLDPKQSLWDAYPTLKAPDGATLIHNDNYADSFSFSETTVYGTVGPRLDLHGRSGPFHAFAYRPDVGLVIEEENPALYRKIVKEDRRKEGRRNPGRIAPGLKEYYARLTKMPALKNTENGVTDIWTTYEYMSKVPAYRRENCPLDIFPQ